jgi:hypothetical protein
MPNLIIRYNELAGYSLPKANTYFGSLLVKVYARKALHGLFKFIRLFLYFIWAVKCIVGKLNQK